MDTVPKDVLMLAILDLDLPSIISLCSTKEDFNEIICKSEIFWRKKLEKDHPNINIDNVKEFKKLYLWLSRKIKCGDNVGDLTWTGAIVGHGESFPLFKKYENKQHKVGDITWFGCQIPFSGKHLMPEKGSEININNVDSADVYFPKYPCGYLSEYSCRFMLYNKQDEIIKNLTPDNKSFVTGPFGEKYSVVIHDIEGVPKGRLHGYLGEYCTYINDIIGVNDWTVC